VGNGALAIGIGRVLDARSPGTARIGVVPKEALAMKLSFEAGRPVATESAATIADGLAVRVPIPAAVDALAKVTDQMLEVSEMGWPAQWSHWTTQASEPRRRQRPRSQPSPSWTTRRAARSC